VSFDVTASLFSGDPQVRLAAVRGSMGDLKDHEQALATAALLGATDRWPALLSDLTARAIHHQPFVNVVITNVRGPQAPLYTMGAQTLECSPVVPLGGNLHVGVGIMSYDGNLAIGLFADGDACPDVALLAEGIEKSFVELGHLARAAEQ
jgi:diacylglycerol O-acyltransferase